MSDLNVVGKANLLIESRHKLNEIEQRLVLLAIAKARSGSAQNSEKIAR